MGKILKKKRKKIVKIEYKKKVNKKELLKEDC